MTDRQINNIIALLKNPLHKEEGYEKLKALQSDHVFTRIQSMLGIEHLLGKNKVTITESNYLAFEIILLFPRKGLMKKKPFDPKHLCFDCVEFKVFPVIPKSVEVLSISDCFNLETITSLTKLDKLKRLVLSQLNLRELPRLPGSLKELECNLLDHSLSIKNLYNRQDIYISGNSAFSLYRNRAWHYLYKKRILDAFLDYCSIIELIPEDNNYIEDAIELIYTIKEIPGAMEIFHQRLKKKPEKKKEAPAAHHFARILYHGFFLQDAAVQLQQVLALDSVNHWAQIDLIEILIAQGQYHLAMTRIESLWKQKINKAIKGMLYFLKAVIQKATGIDPSKSEEHFYSLLKYIKNNRKRSYRPNSLFRHIHDLPLLYKYLEKLDVLFLDASE